jgi:hydrogenase maturation factor/predicted fused transcriptional regulator/phosphomethylpyrimidine kinase
MGDKEDYALYGKIYRALEILEDCTEFVELIPEVRTNLVYAKEDAETPADVLAIDGRITAVEGKPHPAGKPGFGASSHMARLIIEAMKTNPEIRAGVNFANNPEITEFLENYCEQKGWVFSVIDRSKEPDEVKEEEGASMPWKVQETISEAGGVVPDIFYETPAPGKEPVSVLVGKDPVEVVENMCAIAKAYISSKKPAPKIGKIDVDTFESFILERLGKKDKRVIVPPYTGVDAGVVDLEDGRVLVIAEDPIFSIPGQSLEMFGWYTVHIGASDVAVMGVKPEFMTYSLLMPPETPEEDLKTIVDSIHKSALELDISIVGGHTGFYPGFASPTIGGITVFSVVGEDEYVTPAGAQPGNDVILTKGPAIEAVGILSVLREDELKGKYDKETIEKAKDLCKEMTVVKDSLIAMKTGGITAMHDATEGGVMGGLFEIANASGVGMEIDESDFIYTDEINMTCSAFDIDPITSIAEGSLLITVNPEYTGSVIQNLYAEDIPASTIGKVVKDTNKRTIKRLDGKTYPLEIPAQDPFWLAFFEGLQ